MMQDIVKESSRKPKGESRIVNLERKATENEDKQNTTEHCKDQHGPQQNIHYLQPLPKL